MATLLERARALISAKPVVLGALAIVPLASAARTAMAGPTALPYTFTGGSVALNGSSGGSVPGTLGALGNNPLSLNTSGTIDVSAGNYLFAKASALELTWNGTLNTSFFPVNNSTININYDFIIGQTGSGGSVSWSLLDNIGGETLNASSGDVPVSGGSTEVKGSISMPVTAALTGTWSSELDLGWTGFGVPADLTISVPGATSIDLSVSAGVPEPASLGVLGLGAVGLLVRRRRK